VTALECQERLDRSFKSPVQLDPRFLDPVGARAIVTRILHNLKEIYLRRRDHAHGLAVAERLILLLPGDASEVRDRGKVLLALGERQRGARDLEAYLDGAPAAAPDREEVRTLLVGIRKRQALVN